MELDARHHAWAKLVAAVLLLAALMTLVPGVASAFAADEGGGTPAAEASAGSFSGGAGTEESPYLLGSADDMLALQSLSQTAGSTKGQWYALSADVTLPDGWTGIAGFAGTFDGQGHTITVPAGGVAPFASLDVATIRNLGIYGTDIASSGLLSGSVGVGTSTIDSVTVKSGSNVRGSGLASDGSSSTKRLDISNCTVESGVKVGWDASTGKPASQTAGSGYYTGAGGVGSIAGNFSGSVISCTSYADVYGSTCVGGIVGRQAQSMSSDKILNCQFHGTVHATGTQVGGIVGVGYIAVSAPNGTCVSIQNCLVDGTVEAADYVGGIFGGEGNATAGVEEAWSNGIGRVTNNLFAGTVRATAAEPTAVGGIIGYMRGINAYNIIENNLFVRGCGATTGFGRVFHVDTSGVPYGWARNGTFYFDSSRDDLAQVKLVIDGAADLYQSVTGAPGGTRTDNPLSSSRVMRSVDPSALADGTAAAALNGYERSFGNWTYDASGTHLSNDPIVRSLALTGDYKTTYTVGDTVDLSGMTVTATLSDGTTRQVDSSDCVVTYDFSQAGSTQVALRYHGISARYDVTVARAVAHDYDPDISGTVYLTVTDDAHYKVSDGEEAGTVLAYVPVSLADLAEVDLADYGFGSYRLTAADSAADYRYDVSVLQLFCWAQSRYGADGVDGITANGAPGSLYIQTFLGHDLNFNYYVNGVYPEARAGWGSTCDRIALHDGDYVDVDMFSSRSFYTDSAAGFHFFRDADGKVTHSYAAVAGQPAQVSLGRIYSGTNGLAAEPGWAVWCGTRAQFEAWANGTDAESTGATKVTTGTDGKAQVTVADAGDYVLWAEGGKGKDADPNSIVSGPAYATLTVSSPAPSIDRTALETALASAQAQTQGAKSDSAWSTLQAAIASAQAVAADDSATQAQVDEAVTALNAAVEAFEASADAPASLARIDGTGSGSDGADGTAASIARTAFPNGCDAVVLATTIDFKDALSASGLAGALDAPILLNGRDGLSQATAKVIGDLGAKKAYVIGGTYVMPPAIVDALQGMGLSVERIGGEASWDTSLLVAQKAAELGGNQTQAVVASPYSFADALSISGWAYANKVPVVLETEPYADTPQDTVASRTLTDEARAFLSTRSDIRVVGGTGAVSDASVSGLSVTSRYWGSGPYDTSNQIATALYPNATGAIVATGATAAGGLDALASCSLAGKSGVPVLLANGREDWGDKGHEALDVTTISLDGGDAPAHTPSWLASHASQLRQIYVLGGTYVMPQEFVDRIAAAAGVQAAAE